MTNLEFNLVFAVIGRHVIVTDDPEKMIQYAGGHGSLPVRLSRDSLHEGLCPSFSSPGKKTYSFQCRSAFEDRPLKGKACFSRSDPLFSGKYPISR
jgi:hypothetical protein